MTRFLVSALMLVFFGSAAMAQGQYRIQPGDMLSIEVLEDSALNRNALVLPDGSISFPMVGSVAAGGKTLDAVKAAITSGLAPNFASPPNVFVTVSALNSGTRATSGGTSRSFNVYIIGAVNNPGKAKVRSGTSLLQFLAESGGFSKFAATKRIQVRRTDRSGNTTVYKYNYKAIENGSASGAPFILHKGDVIVVPERRLFE